MNIVIIAEFCEDFSGSDNGRFLYLAKMLSEENDVEIITSSFRHTTKRHRRKPYAKWSFRITFIEEPGYPKNICIQRFQSHFAWGRNLLKYMKSRTKPDVVYCAVPSLTGPNLIAKYCEKNGIRFIIDIQDLWPEAFQMVVNIPVISRTGFAPFRSLADGIYERADTVCAVSQTYAERALKNNKKCDKGIVVFLGTDLDTFDRNACQKHKLALQKNEEEIWIAYCGTLGRSYDITVVIDALEILNDDRIRFIVMGDGPEAESFRTYAGKKGIQSVFTGRLPYDQMCGLLSACDIAANPIMHNAAQSIINKHADYTAAGLPIINTQESKEFCKLIDDYQMGFTCKNGNAAEVAQAIRVLADDAQRREQMGKNSRRCAEELFDRKNSYEKLKAVILEEPVY